MIPIVNFTSIEEAKVRDHKGITKFADIIGDKFAKMLNLDHINFDEDLTLP